MTITDTTITGATIDERLRKAIHVWPGESGDMARAAVERIESLTHTVSECRARERDAVNTLATFKTQVRDAVVAAKDKHDLCLDGTNSFLEELGLPEIATDRVVTVSSRYGNHLASVTVSGDDADTDDEAIEYVKQNIESSLESVEITMTLTICGSNGESEDASVDSDDEYAVSDSWTDSFLDDLSFDVEPA